MKILMKAGKASALDWSKWKDFLINGAIVVSSAAITYVLDNVAKMDFGSNGTVIVAVVSLVLKYALSWIQKLAQVNPQPNPPAPKPTDPDFNIINK